MGEASKGNLTRPKLQNVALPQAILKCFLCAKVLDRKTNEFHSIAIDGVVFFACEEHCEPAKQMAQYTKTYLDRLKKSAAEQETQTE